MGNIIWCRYNKYSYSVSRTYNSTRGFHFGEFQLLLLAVFHRANLSGLHCAARSSSYPVNLMLRRTDEWHRVLRVAAALNLWLKCLVCVPTCANMWGSLRDFHGPPSCVPNSLPCQSFQLVHWFRLPRNRSYGIFGGSDFFFSYILENFLLIIFVRPHF